MVRTHYTPARKPAAAKESHQSIQDQTSHFLASGGKIENVALGMTGQMGISTHQFTISRPLFNKKYLH
ncbi:MAG: hypothetical protein HRU20_22745 [Pseudomonadales bacterium]|nr:hypothetical protein [Pseudomonadales bacterium]